MSERTAEERTDAREWDDETTMRRNMPPGADVMRAQAERDAAGLPPGVLRRPDVVVGAVEVRDDRGLAEALSALVGLLGLLEPRQHDTAQAARARRVLARYPHVVEAEEPGVGVGVTAQPAERRPAADRAAPLDPP